MRGDGREYRRRSRRIAGYDYSQAGVYFVTLVAQERRMVFGEVRDGGVQLSAAGEVARSCWLAIPEHFGGCSLGEFVVMPNHVHGLLVLEGGWATHASPLRLVNTPHQDIDPTGDRATHASPLRKFVRVARMNGDGDDPANRSSGRADQTARHVVVGATHASPSPTAGTTPPRGPGRHSLGAIVGSYKSATTRLVNRNLGTPGCPLWQRNFFEHVVRDADSLLHIAEYIVTNPLRWDLDPENPASCRADSDDWPLTDR